jgi:hypothetical protein
MATTETRVIDRVEQDGQWHRVFFDGSDDPASTKDANLAKVAMAHRGQEVEVVLNETQRGKYTNIYLNGIGGETEQRSAPSKSAPAPRRGNGGGRDANTQNTIAAQWAVGRALEVFTLTDSSVDLKGLTDAQQSFIEATAVYVASLRDKLAGN